MKNLITGLMLTIFSTSVFAGTLFLNNDAKVLYEEIRSNQVIVNAIMESPGRLLNRLENEIDNLEFSRSLGAGLSRVISSTQKEDDQYLCTKDKIWTGVEHNTFENNTSYISYIYKCIAK